jgi:outer membrane lipoprotein-sorting protein
MKIVVSVVVIILAALLLVYFAGPFDGASVAWGSLGERLEQIPSYSCHGYSTITSGPDKETVTSTWVSSYSEYGIRMESFTGEKLTMISYTLPQEKSMLILTILPEQKQYMRMVMAEEQSAKKFQAQRDPREMVRQLLAIEYTKLGRDTIDGIGVEGIETTDPEYCGGWFDKIRFRLWVDIETQLPVRTELEAQREFMGKLTTTSGFMDGFEWGVEFDPDFFEPEIPDDYTLISETTMPNPNEESVITILRDFAEKSGGKYPSKLDIETITTERFALRPKMPERPAGSKRPPMPGTPTMEEFKNPEKRQEYERQMKEYDEAFEKECKEFEEWCKKFEEWRKEQDQEMPDDMGKCMNDAMATAAAIMFYKELAKEGKEPEYYGDTVTAEDGDLVLMRWEISDDEYRVIFGDLTVENISAMALH